MIKKYAMIAFKEVRNFLIIIAVLALVIYVASLLEPAPKTDAELKAEVVTKYALPSKATVLGVYGNGWIEWSFGGNCFLSRVEAQSSVMATIPCKVK